MDCGGYGVGRRSDAGRYGEFELWKDCLIGKAAVCLYTRMKSYQSESTRHLPEIARRIGAERNHLWFHVQQSDNPALTESLLLWRRGYFRNDGLYEWNRRDERRPRTAHRS